MISVPWGQVPEPWSLAEVPPMAEQCQCQRNGMTSKKEANEKSTGIYYQELTHEIMKVEMSQDPEDGKLRGQDPFHAAKPPQTVVPVDSMVSYSETPH